MPNDIPPIISFIGSSGVGKTTFLTRVIAALKGRRYRVAVIKHHSHSGIEIDRPGKDTWRYSQSGADTVIFAAPDKLALFHRPPSDLQPDEIVHLLPAPVDIVITEGYKHATHPQPTIQLLRAAHGKQLVGDPTHLIALVTDLLLSEITTESGHDHHLSDLALFALDDVDGVVDFLERHFNLARPGKAAVPPPLAR